MKTAKGNRRGAQCSVPGTLVVWLLAITLIASLASAAEPAPFREFVSGQQVRDAVVDAARGVAYLTVYNRNEVWCVDLGSRETLASVEVGAGPVALAMSVDGETLACVNRLANTATLLNADDLTVLGTVECGGGPADVAALPGGGFAVANSFSDSLSVFSAEDPTSSTTIEGVSGVPNGVAANAAPTASAIRTAIRA